MRAAATHNQRVDSFAPLEFHGAPGRGVLPVTCGGAVRNCWRIRQFGSYSHENGRDRIIEALDGDLFNCARLLKSLGETSDLSARYNIVHRRRAGNIVLAIVIGEFHAVAKYQVFSLPALVSKCDFGHGSFLMLIIAATWVSPAAYSAEKMQFICFDSNMVDLDFLWVCPRIVLPAL